MKLWRWLLLEDAPRGLRLLAMASTGALVGLALYVADISEAASYLSDDPEACINCHIMIPQYATWRHSSHGRDTVCNDCHVPQDSIFAKYYFKAKDGLRHSALFTLNMQRQVIQAIPESQHVIQENCIRCHSRIIEGVREPIHGGYDRACIECHREVPHGRVHSLTGTPNAAVPPLGSVAPEWLLRGRDTGGNGGNTAATPETAR